jgi:hypothetical protein
LIYVFFKTQDDDVRIAALLGSLVIFSGGMFFSLNPVIAPMHIPLYGFLLYALVLKKNSFAEELSAFPLKKGLALVFMTFLASGASVLKRAFMAHLPGHVYFWILMALYWWLSS